MTARQRIQVGMAIGALLVVAWLFYLARSALIPFFIGALLAYVLSPLVDVTARSLPFHSRREELARATSILLLYCIGALLLVVSGILVLPGIINDVGELIRRSPAYFEGARQQFDQWSHLYDDLDIPPEVRSQIDDAIGRLGGSAAQLLQGMVGRTVGFVTQTFSIVIGFFAVPFWLFYVLKDQHRGTAWFYNIWPGPLQQDVRAIGAIINHALGSYVRVQLTLAFIIGSVTAVGLLLMGVPSAIALGVIAGFTELIPVLGPIIATVIACTVTLATEPSMTPWVLLFFFAVQQLENSLLVPRIQGHAVQIHPAVIIVLLVIANQMIGIWGMLIAVPLAAVARDTFLYIYHRLDDETPLEALLEAEEGQPARDQAELIREAFGDEETPAVTQEISPPQRSRWMPIWRRR